MAAETSEALKDQHSESATESATGENNTCTFMRVETTCARAGVEFAI